MGDWWGLSGGGLGLGFGGDRGVGGLAGTKEIEGSRGGLSRVRGGLEGGGRGISGWFERAPRGLWGLEG